jgi:hypothetical protein
VTRLNKASLLLFLAALPTFASESLAGPPEALTPPRRSKITAVPHTDTARTLAAAYYSLKSGLDATLMLSNQGPHPMPVEIRLFSLSGEPFDLGPVTLAAKEARAFDLSAVVPKGSVFEEGSLAVTFHGKNLELGGVLNLTDIARSLIFDEELSEPATMFASSRLEGVWWLPERGAKVRVVVSNTTEHPLVARVGVDGVTPKSRKPAEIALAPHATRVLRLDDLADGPVRSLARVGGVSISHTGPKGGLLARVLIQKPSVGYSDAIELWDPAKVESTKLDGAGLRIGLANGSALTQVLVARNVGSRALRLDGRVPYLTASGREGIAHLSTVRLAPGEIREINLAAALARSGVASAASAGLELEHTGAPGDLVASALAVSADGTQVFRVPLRDAALSSSTGIYPWSLDGGSTAIVYIKNATAEPRDYSLHLDFEGGPYVFPLQTVLPRQTVAIDLRALRDRQAPDVFGKTIPRQVKAGKAQWSMSGPVQNTLIGRIEQADLAHGMSFTAACGACCPNSTIDAWMDPSFVSGFPGGTTQFRVWTVEEDCFGSQQPWYPTGAFFYSTDTSVATVTWGGFAQAVGLGSTFIRADFQGVDYHNCAAEAANEEYCCDSAPVVIPCEAVCQVQPSVEIEVTKTAVQNDDLVRLKTDVPAKRHKNTSRARVVNSPPQDVTVVLTNPDGRLRFPDTNNTTKTLTLPRNGDWVEFEISGETKSNAKDDAVIEAHCNSAPGPLCGRENLTVFYFDATVSVTAGGSYAISGNVYGPTNQAAAVLKGKATLKPDNLDCSAAPLKDIRIGFVQNAKPRSAVYLDQPMMTWEPATPAGTMIETPTEFRVTIALDSFLLDSSSNSAPLYDKPGTGQIDANSVKPPVGCTNGGEVTTNDSPTITVGSFVRQPRLPNGSIAGTITYNHLRRATSEREFRVWLVSVEGQEVLPLRETSWSLNLDSDLTTPQKATPAGSDKAPENAPLLTGTFANDAVSNRMNHTVEAPDTTVTFTKPN